MKELTLGSLFSGSGGFELAGALNGITPVWASEIESFPIRVTKLRFPNMKHLGDVTKINGAEVEPVDIITFGSPCQDLSVAGKQTGIHEGQRSNLFFEAIRIIKEMRERDRASGRADFDLRPRFAVWENVPGAFSSNKGEDFRAVLQAFCEVGGGEADSVPSPPGGKWTPAGCVVGNGYSVAWRVYDAQYWGVPQRRKRIYLIADFGSERAGEILFEREGMPGNPEPGGKAWQGTASDAEGGSAGSGGDGLRLFATHPHDSRYEGPVDVAQTVSQQYGTGGNNTPHVVRGTKDAAYSIEGHVIDRKSEQNGRGWAEGYAHTINATDRNAVAFGIDQQGGKSNCGYAENVMPTICSDSHGMSDRQQTVCFQQNQRDEVRDMGESVGALTAESGSHNQNYVCYPGTARTLSARHDSSPCVDRGQNVVCINNRADTYGDKTETLRAECHQAVPVVGMEDRRDGKAVCCQNTGQGWWNEGEVAQTLRTPCGGDSTKANLVVEKADDGIVCYEGQTLGWDGAKAFTLQAGRPDDHHIPGVCYVPKAKDCSDFEQADTSASLLTKYHYGSGGDAALCVKRTDENGADDGKKD